MYSPKMSRDEIMIINRIFIHNVKLLWFIGNYSTTTQRAWVVVISSKPLEALAHSWVSIFLPGIRSELLLFLYLVQGRASEGVAEVFKASYLEVNMRTALAELKKRGFFSSNSAVSSQHEVLRQLAGTHICSEAFAHHSLLEQNGAHAHSVYPPTPLKAVLFGEYKLKTQSYYMTSSSLDFRKVAQLCSVPGQSRRPSHTISEVDQRSFAACWISPKHLTR